MKDVFVPRTVFVTESASQYPACDKMIDAFRKAGSDIIRGNPRLPRGLSPSAKYVRAKSLSLIHISGWIAPWPVYILACLSS